MKILRLLNKIFFSITLFILSSNAFAEEQPVDIWNIEKENTNQNQSNSAVEKQDNSTLEQTTFEINSNNQISQITLENNIESKQISIIGLYDPEDYGLNMNMWSYSNGDQLKNILIKLQKINLSKDANEIMNILMLTNSHFPKQNISEKEFLNFKSNWLIKNSDLDLIEEYLIKNQIINSHVELTTYLVNQYLSQSNIEKACEIFLNNKESINDNYLSKFHIYCLVNSDKTDEAQLILDLKKELGFNDKYFEKKINLLFGYDLEEDKEISEKTILDFHLAHRTNKEFNFEPNDTTSKIIWEYLSSANLLYDVKEIEITDLDKISIIEKAVNNQNYSEDELFELYKRFQFSIDQLLNAKEFYKSLSNIEAKALIYQRILIESDSEKKLEFLKLLKDLFVKQNISNAFNYKLKNFLEALPENEIPSNFIGFYQANIKDLDKLEKKIKFSSDILHQSKLVNYFNGDYTESKIKKDINNFLKKIKKDKKYFFSKKDVIFLESLKADGIEISKKFDNLYEINESEIPTDIQVMINNSEVGAALLRIVEVIGEDQLENLDDDTLYFIISTLNQLNIDFIRNRILLKVLPLKV